MKYIWISFFIFFAIPFPAFMYYSIRYGTPGEITSTYSWLAVCYLSLSIVVWSYVLMIWFKKWVLASYIFQSTIRNLLRYGQQIEAYIINSEKVKSYREKDTLKITVSMRNFVDEEIAETLFINDADPYKNRYAEGNTIRIRIDKQLETRPVMIHEDVQATPGRSTLFLNLIIWLIITGTLAGYYYFSYTTEGKSHNWHFLTFYHPLIICGVVMLIFQYAYYKFTDRINGLPHKMAYLKYYGLRTQAKVLNAKETGVYINNHPEVRFEITFSDYAGKTHNTTIKKIVSMAQLAVNPQQTASVFYLKSDPTQAIFSTDIEA